VSTPKAALVVPVYNGERFLQETIESLLSQDVDVEIVAVDDGSTDGSLDILRRYGNRIQVVEQPNRGVCIARNTGFARTKAPYVTFLDQDDWLENTFAQKMSAALDVNADAVAVYCEAIVHENAGDVFGLQEGDHTENMYFALLRGVCPMSPGAVMVRRDAFISVGGFDPSLQNIGEDLDLWIKLARYYSWTYLPQHLYNWRGHGGNMSERFIDMYRGNKHLLSRYTKLTPLGDADAALAKVSLRQKQLRCVWDIRRTMKKKARARQLRAAEVWPTIQGLLSHPELIPHLLRIPLRRRR
jgi:glycosyltransferase involved in cell wall biosynthesis